ncbi:MAG: 30S ribosomal protein S1 [Thermonema sp.]|uniref:30S ribosomal protein S1 n=1 Tax=Thermonema sp. TaxID=2231181 RepID=UPI0021DDA5EC|nr:30S ribosomal protein S1 [Thermonema sp.]GIV39067.1 MAG: 30S ribosomal protein S1 [Thermonema sp.]
MSNQPIENFNWEELENEKKFADATFSGAKDEELAKLYEQSLGEINEREVVTGTVVSITDRDVVINVGFKSDGLVPLTEFRDMPDLKPGDQVEVYVEKVEDANGQVQLSRKKAKLVRAWEKISEAYENDLVVEGVVKRRTKGGLVVDLYGIECFLPGSQIDVKPIRDFDAFVGKKMELKVVKVNYSNDNVVVSHKVLIEKDLEEQRQQILNNLERGQVLEGVIKNMTNFGVFIDLGGVDGLLHITDISWGRISHPSELLELDQKVKVVVLDFDEEKKRISLGMKQLTPHPWDSLPEDIQVGSRVKGKIVNVADYGAFLEIMPGVEGLIHVSEMSWSQHLRNPQDFLKVGDEVEAVVLTLDREERKMSLGIKQLTEDPWTRPDIATKYAVGTVHKGIVRNMTNYGLFLELEEGIDGLVHVSDLSWTQKIKHPSEFIQVGEELEVKVLEFDLENRRIALGHKQLQPDPWDAIEERYAVGTTHEGKVLNVNEKGAVVELEENVEGFCPKREMTKEDGSLPKEGDKLNFVVIEFSKGERRIILSHVKTYVPDDKVVEEKLNKKEDSKVTLGDLEELSNLKEQMEKDKEEGKE